MNHAGFSDLSYSKDRPICAAAPSERQARIPTIGRLLQDERGPVMTAPIAWPPLPKRMVRKTHAQRKAERIAARSDARRRAREAAEEITNRMKEPL